MQGSTLTVIALLVAWPLVLAGGPSIAEAEVPAHTGPLPFDPLSPDEEARAVEVAVSDPQVDALLSDQYEVIGAALFTDKAFAELPQWPRMAEVWFYDYTADRAVRSTVDLGLGVVATVETSDVQPPLTASEIDRAAEAALAEPRVAEALTARGVDPDGVGWTARLWSSDACLVERCVMVAFVDGDDFIWDLMVLVDMASGGVVEIVDGAAEASA